MTKSEILYEWKILFCEKYCFPFNWWNYGLDCIAVIIFKADPQYTHKTYLGFLFAKKNNFI